MKKKLSGFLPILIYLLTGGCIGLVCGYQIENWFFPSPSMEKGLLLIIIVVFFIYLAILLQLILHEVGHLLFGLASGYRFSSFRIGSFLWLKENGRLRCKRYSLAGTGGQCLMEPPEPVDGSIPYVLYNLGGVFLNGIASALFAILYMLAKPIPLLALFYFIVSAFGIALALINGIPLHMGTVNNDGHNAISMGKSPEALHCFWLQMKVNAEITRGLRLKDMPDAWFPRPSECELDNSIVAAACTLSFSRAMDQMDFSLAEQIGQTLLQQGTGLVPLHRALLQLELVYCELVGANRSDRLAELQTKPYKNLMKAMRTHPSIPRIQYTCALLQDGDPVAAEKCYRRFEQACKRHPYPGEIENEQDLISHVQHVAAQRTNKTETM